MSAGRKWKAEAIKTSPNESFQLVWAIGMTQWWQMTRQWRGKAQTTRLHRLGCSMFQVFSSYDSFFTKLITNVLLFLSSNNHNYHAVVGTTTYDDKGTTWQQHRPSSLITTMQWRWRWRHGHLVTTPPPHNDDDDQTSSLIITTTRRWRMVSWRHQSSTDSTPYL